MSQDENPRTTDPAETQLVADGSPSDPGDANAPTLGTGTSIALGCVAGTVVLILIGLIYILILTIF